MRNFMVPLMADGSLAMGAWGTRHNAARRDRFNPIVGFVDALRRSAEAHRRRYGSPIGDDAVIGAAWLAIARATIELLNGETGGLDGGTVDRSIRDLAEEHGFDRDLTEE